MSWILAFCAVHVDSASWCTNNQRLVQFETRGECHEALKTMRLQADPSKTFVVAYCHEKGRK